MKLAILGLSTFGYFERLAEHATAAGVPTAFFDERPSNDIFTKLKFRLAPKAVGRHLGRAHIRAICEKIIAQKFTHVLVIFAEIVSEDELQMFKDHGISVSRFTWDSVGNRSDVRSLDHIMEAIGSFDPVDCERYGYTYIPLYSEVISPEKVGGAQERDLDFFFCGTMHSNRPRILDEVMRLCEKRGWQGKFSLFYHSRKLYLLRNALSKPARAIFGEISETSFAHAETLEDSRRCRVVIDLHHPKQNGLTMRSFEALAQGAILATTNRAALSLVDASLQDRVVFLDITNLEDSLQRALERTPGPLDREQYYLLSLDRFLGQIFTLLGRKP